MSAHRYDSYGYEADGHMSDDRFRQQEPSLADLLGDLSDDVTTLFRQEVELAKVEVKQEAVEAGKAAGMLLAGAIAGFVTLLLIAWAAAWALALAMPIWAGFLIVAVVFAAVTAALVQMGRSRLERFDPVPHRTIETLQADTRVLTERTRR